MRSCGVRPACNSKPCACCSTRSVIDQWGMGSGGEAPHGAAPAGTSSAADVSPAMSDKPSRPDKSDPREVVTPQLDMDSPPHPQECHG